MPGIERSLADYLRTVPTLKYLFFGGKGGVGKTVMAGATGLHLAQQGKRTLLASTNPVHSLSGLLDQNCYGKAVAVAGVPNLWAYEIDTKENIERSKQDIKQKIRWFLKFAEISAQADAFVESATMNPAFEESAMFETMVDLMFKDEYDAYVFDTAPTANARRLRDLLSFTKKKEADPLMDYLVSFRERIGHARELLTDKARTAFFFVTLPEALPIAVIKRFIQWFHDFGIPVGGVVVNMLIRKDQVEQGGPDFVKNRVAMQEAYMQEIWRDFDGAVRAVIPLFDNEVRGVESLRKVLPYAFTTPSQGAS